MMRPTVALAAMAGLCAPLAAFAAGYAIVTVPVADIRNEPKGSTPGKYEIDMAQETQVLLGDGLRVLADRGDWLEVEVLAQETFKADKRVPYPGLISSRMVRIVPEAPKPRFTVVTPSVTLRTTPTTGAPSEGVALLGTRLEAAPSATATGDFVGLQHPNGKTVYVARHEVREYSNTPTVSRQSLVALASRFLDSRYHWGGFSFPFQNEHRELSTGVDCSGLMGLVYRAFGVALPRNAKDIFRAGEKIKLGDLRRGDFVFVSKSADPMKIRHVMMFDEGERFIESTNADKSVVRFSTFPDLFALSREALDARGGKVADDRWVMAARFPAIAYTD